MRCRLNPELAQMLVLRISAMGDTNMAFAAEEWVAKSGREGRADTTLSKKLWMLSIGYPLPGSNSVIYRQARKSLPRSI